MAGQQRGRATAPKTSSEDKTSGWVKLIESITAPLGFYVLALLIIEAFLGTVLVGAGAGLDRADKIIGMYLGVGLFVFVVSVVSILVIFFPRNLTFDKAAHLDDRAKTPYGSDDRRIDIDTLLSADRKGTK